MNNMVRADSVIKTELLRKTGFKVQPCFCVKKCQVFELIFFKKNAVSAETSIKQAEKNLCVTRISDQEGLATDTDLLDVISSLSRANFTYIDAKREIFANYFNITRAVKVF